MRDALAVVSDEQERIADERDAFAQFAQQVSIVTTSSIRASSRSGGGVATALEPPPVDSQLQQIKQAYRETIMAVPHYKADYDESLEENLSAEFSEELATAVTEGRQLTPQLKQALVQASLEARNQRTFVIDAIDDEIDELDDAKEEFETVEDILHAAEAHSVKHESFDTLYRRRQRLCNVESRCEELLAERQDCVQDGYTLGLRSIDAQSLQQYLYQSLDVDYPVLADGTKTFEEVRKAKRRITQLLMARR